MRVKLKIFRSGCASNRAFTLAEAAIAGAIATLSFGGILFGYMQSSRTAEWSAYSLAAESLAIQQMEQTRAARWDPNSITTVDELVQTNFPSQTNVLDVPVSGTNRVYATNTTFITTISNTPPLRMITVNCVWSFINKRAYTNSIFTYRAPDY